MYRILLTGSTGFIGGHVLKYLTDLGYQVDVLTRKNWPDMEKTYKLIGANNVIVHCAWIREQDLHSHEHLRFALQTIEFYNMCKELGKRVINIGSSSEYGVKYKPMKESMRCEPINTYGLAKLMVTLHAKKLGYNTLRLFTVAGEGGHSFMDKYESADKWGSLYDNRDFVNVSTVSKSIERLIHAQHIYSEIINIGSGKEIHYHDVVTLGEAWSNSSDKWDKYPQRQYEPYLWQADITKMKKLLNL